MYTRLQQPTTSDDADTNNPASVAIDGDVAPLPPLVHAYENVAEQSGMNKYYSFVSCMQIWLHFAVYMLKNIS